MVPQRTTSLGLYGLIHQVERRFNFIKTYGGRSLPYRSFCLELKSCDLFSSFKSKLKTLLFLKIVLLIVIIITLLYRSSNDSYCFAFPPSHSFFKSPILTQIPS